MKRNIPADFVQAAQVEQHEISGTASRKREVPDSAMLTTYISVMVNHLLQLVVQLLFPIYPTIALRIFSSCSAILEISTITTGFTMVYITGENRISTVLILCGYFFKLMQFIVCGPINSVFYFSTVISFLHTLPVILVRLLNPGESAIVLVIFFSTAYSCIQTLDALWPTQNSPIGFDLQNLGSYPGVVLTVLNVLGFYWFQLHQSGMFYRQKLKQMWNTNLDHQKNITNFEVQIAQLVHEIKHPLQSITGSLEVLRKTIREESQQQEELFEVATASVDHLQNMITNMLEFSKLRANKIELNLASVNMVKMTKKIIKMHYFKARDNHNKLQLHVSTNFPKNVIADEQRIKQVIINLLSNAIKFTNNGIVCIKLGWRSDPITQHNLAQSEDDDDEKSLQYVEERSLFKQLENRSIPSNGNDSDSSQADNHSIVGSSKEEAKEPYRQLQSYSQLIHNSSECESNLGNPRKQSTFTDINKKTDGVALQSNLQAGTNIYEQSFYPHYISVQQKHELEQAKSMPHDLSGFGVQPENMVDPNDAQNFGDFMDRYLLHDQEEYKITNKTETREHLRTTDQQISKEDIVHFNSPRQPEEDFKNNREVTDKPFGSPRSVRTTSMDLMLVTSRSDLPNLNTYMERLENQLYKSMMSQSEEEEVRQIEPYNIRKRLSDIQHANESNVSSSVDGQKERAPESSPSFQEPDMRCYKSSRDFKEEYKGEGLLHYEGKTLPIITKKCSFADYSSDFPPTNHAPQEPKQLLYSQDFSTNLRLDDHKQTAFFPGDLGESKQEEKPAPVPVQPEQSSPTNPSKQSESSQRDTVEQLNRIGDTDTIEQLEKQSSKISRKKQQFQQLHINSCQEAVHYFHSSSGNKKKASQTLTNYKQGMGDIMRFHSVIQTDFRRSHFRHENTSPLQGYQAETGTLIIEVKDSGKGISEEGIKRLFKPFQQEDKTISKKYGGTGLGLCICHDLVTLMNGTINVESKRKFYTSFTIKIPLRRSNDITGMIDDEELDIGQFELDLAQFEFALINKRDSFELQQIRRFLIGAGQKCSVFAPNQLADQQLFQREHAIKAVIVDSRTLIEKKIILQTLNSLYEHADSSEQVQNLQQNQKISRGLFKIPIIVVLTDFDNEYKIPRLDNYFILKSPLNQISIQKMMLMIKKYYFGFSEQARQSQDAHRDLETAHNQGSSDVSLPHLGSMTTEGQSSFKIQKENSIGQGYMNLQSHFSRINSVQPNNQVLKHMTMGRFRKGSYNTLVPEKGKEEGKQQKQNSSKQLGDRYDYLERDRIIEGQSVSSSKTLPQRGKLSQTGPKILIVNDEKMLVDVFEQQIKIAQKELKTDIAILKAKDGNQAVDIFQQQSNIQCILMDINMPSLNGYEATQKIRMLEKERNSLRGLAEQVSAYIVGVSGETDNKHVQKCKSSGMNEVLLTTLNISKVKELILKVYN